MKDVPHLFAYTREEARATAGVALDKLAPLLAFTRSPKSFPVKTTPPKCKKLRDFQLVEKPASFSSFFASKRVKS